MRPLVIGDHVFGSPGELTGWIDQLSPEERIAMRDELRKGTSDEVYCSLLLDPGFDKFILESIAKASYVRGEPYEVHFDKLIPTEG